MAFFKKLKDRLFKSSSKLEEGLDAIVEEGGAPDVAAEVEDAPAVSVAQTPQDPIPAPIRHPRSTPKIRPSLKAAR